MLITNLACPNDARGLLYDLKMGDRCIRALKYTRMELEIGKDHLHIGVRRGEHCRS
jgi:hypothetical protein